MDPRSGDEDDDWFPIAVDASKARRELGWRPHYDTTATVMRALCAV